MPPKSTKSARKDDADESLIDPSSATPCSPDLESMIQRVVRKELDAFKVVIMSLLNTKLLNLEKRVLKIEQSTAIQALEHELSDLKKQLTSQASKFEDLDAYSRSDNLIIKGLPEGTFAERAAGSGATDSTSRAEESHKVVETTVINFCRDKLKIDLLPRDISTAHRLRAGPKDSTRPIIVRFANRSVRDDVYRAKSLLKNQPSRVFISEHLTKSSAELYYHARALLKEKKIVSTWTQHGQVMIRFTSDATKKPVTVRSRQDLTPHE